jgi:hypothetical protein
VGRSNKSASIEIAPGGGWIKDQGAGKVKTEDTSVITSEHTYWSQSLILVL